MVNFSHYRHAMKSAKIILLLFTLLFSACAGPVAAPEATPTAEPSSTPVRRTYTPRPPTATSRSTFTPAPTATAWPINVSLTIQTKAQGQTFSPFVLGSNLPNWLSKAQFENEQFRQRVAASGLTMIRIPGGAFADDYGWLSCELGRDVPNALPCTYNYRPIARFHHHHLQWQPQPCR